ncbi:attractin-like protein 1 isoform X1 [Dreissena polymorpha]|uniref:attractin-like protein 1 isoform X1 n=1 Tax=Dreissena polymorpha TaxID=45954 RepID=UPI0022647AB9|nr:attractin-like protein 1 isoform X1 [Dreissena polymorpha]
MAEEKRKMLSSLNNHNHSLKRPNVCIILMLIIMICAISNVSCQKKCKDLPCENGECKQNNTVCECFPGWAGSSCTHCSGRVRLTNQSGIITDGSGNYTTDNKCMWLVVPNPPGGPIRLATHQFATECGWDHLYIFDGDSVFAPLIASYSGLVQQELNTSTAVGEIVAWSGKAYIYFYSDAAYNMTGFHLKYRLAVCPRNCSGNGQCNTTSMSCECDTGFTGEACDMPKCPNNCSLNGLCTSEGYCNCYDGFKGSDCSIAASSEYWIRHVTRTPPQGRASAASVVVGDELVISGGYAFGEAVHFLVAYNITSHEWRTLSLSLPQDIPKYLYGHCMVHYEKKIYIFGGVSQRQIEMLLWTYDVTLKTWSSSDYNVSRAVAGHSCVLVGSKMYIIFGHSPVYGYMNRVHVMDLASSDRSLVTVATTGAQVKGGYGASSVYNAHLGQIFVYGGYISGDSTTQYSLTDKLLSFNPLTSVWRIHAGSGSPRYLHSAVFLGEIMLVFGGNTHNDTSISYGAKCYSPDFLAYDPKCNSWKYLTTVDLLPNAVRYGHVAQAYTDSTGENKMLVFGGFDGVMRNDVMEYHPADCTPTNSTQCVPDMPGRVCVCAWNETEFADKKDRETILRGTNYREGLCVPNKGAEEFCFHNRGSCGSCLSSEYGCKWCSNNCTTICSADSQYEVTNSSMCLGKYNNMCGLLQNCLACQEAEGCSWSKQEKKCTFRELSDGVHELTNFFKKVSSSAELEKEPGAVCDAPCQTHTSCENCTKSMCMWCSSQERCVETNSYVASFLYGQCQEWVTNQPKCSSTKCSDLATCDECKNNPACGWCNDESNTGLGRCMQGSYVGPMTLNNGTGEYEVDTGMCPALRWHFVDCPLCQCNGHSSCTNVSNVCDACQNLTMGKQCERCIEGYYGNPRNGGKCSVCHCNGQADKCSHETGACYCRTRGVKGTNCTVCDEENNYFGDPNNGKTCYYNLKTDYQFTFNLSKNEDLYYKGINFMNIPQASDRDVDFTLNCSSEEALINITYTSRSRPQEQVLTSGYQCRVYRAKFEHKDYDFGSNENVTIYVYVYNFTTPFWLQVSFSQISFSQFPKIDLVHFFVTFFSCFLSLLIIAAVLYKIKHKYDSYRRRQRMMVEMEEMASRPFAMALLEIEPKSADQAGADKKDTNPDLRKRKRVSERLSHIAMEPLHHQKAAVLSLFIQLPSGDLDWAPPGNSGLAIGSTLISIGHQRKQSIEFPKAEKTKHKKAFDTNV